MASNYPVDPRQVALVAGVAKAIVPVQQSRKVKVVNSTSEELDIYADPTDVTSFLRIAAGQSEIFEAGMGAPSVGMFRPGVAAFYALCAVDGTVTLIWT